MLQSGHREATKPLNYAPKPAGTRRVRRWVLRAAVGALLIGLVVFWSTIGASTVRRVYWLNRCLHFQQPAGHLVWEINRGAVVHQEVCAPKHAILDGPLCNGCGNIFVHEMQRPDGTSRLVAVVIEPWWPTDAAGTFRMCYQTWEPSMFIKETQWGYLVVPAGSGTQLSDWKFFAGQPDPANPSHFTFDYDVDGTRHTCDVWLKNDGNLVISQRP